MKNSFGNSKKLHEQALKTLVGGVNSPVRSFARVGGTPLLAKEAKGSFLWDVDGNRYLDLVMSYGPHLLGHANEAICEILKKAVEKGFCFGMSSEAEITWAEKVCSIIPSIEKVRAMSTGTEACMTAVRLARGHTKRDIILKFSGHYHGHVDALMVDSGSGIATLSDLPNPDSAGLPKGVIENTRVVEFNSVEQIEEAFNSFGEQIAAVILEPIMGNMGVIPASKEFLLKTRELCTKHESLLILDEVMTGFRVHEQSAQGLYDITPDLTCLGKVVGGGLPLSALGGSAKVMNSLAPLGNVYQAGTLSGNPLCILAGLTMLQEIEKTKPYAALEECGQVVENLLNEKASKSGVKIQTQRVGSMLSVFFRGSEVKNAQDSRDVNYDQFNAYFWAMLEEGILLPPSPFEAYFLASTHSKDLLEGLDQKLDRVFEKVAKI